MIVVTYYQVNSICDDFINKTMPDVQKPWFYSGAHLLGTFKCCEIKAKQRYLSNFWMTGTILGMLGQRKIYKANAVFKALICI